MNLKNSPITIDINDKKVNIDDILFLIEKEYGSKGLSSVVMKIFSQLNDQNAFYCAEDICYYHPEIAELLQKRFVY